MAGYDHSLALLSNRTVVTWGGGGDTTPESDVPVAVPGLAHVTAIVVGFGDNLALLSNGKVMAWVDNGNGQLGDGTTTDSEVPVRVVGLTHVTAIAGGIRPQPGPALQREGHGLGRRRQRRVGDGRTTDSDVPVVVSGLRDVTAIAAGDFHSLALVSDGKAKAWGDNFYGELGIGTTDGPQCVQPFSRFVSARLRSP